MRLSTGTSKRRPLAREPGAASVEGDRPNRIDEHYPTRGRGRHPKDLVERMRASSWARQVRDESGKSWYRLDGELMGVYEDKTPQYRAFDRIARVGDSPEWVSNQFDLVSLAAALAPIATANYRAEIWRLLSVRKLPAIRQLQDLSDHLLDQMGLVQLNASFADIDRAVCGPFFPATPGNHEQIQHGAHAVATNGSLDAILVLSIQARLAIERLSLMEGHFYIEALRDATSEYDRRFKVEELSGLLLTACLDRIVRGIWKEYDQVNWPFTAKVMNRDIKTFYERNPESQLREQYETGPLAPVVQDRRTGVPIVKNDDRMRDYQQHRNAVVSDVHRFASEASIGNSALEYEQYPALAIATQLWNSECQPFEFFVADCNGFVSIASKPDEVSRYATNVVRVAPWEESKPD